MLRNSTSRTAAPAKRSRSRREPEGDAGTIRPRAYTQRAGTFRGTGRMSVMRYVAMRHINRRTNKGEPVMQLAHSASLLAALVLSLASPAGAQTAANPSGHWDGTVKMGDQTIPISLDLAKSPTGA